MCHLFKLIIFMRYFSKTVPAIGLVKVFSTQIITEGFRKATLFPKLIERCFLGLRIRRFTKTSMKLSEGLLLLPDRRLPIGQKQINALCEFCGSVVRNDVWIPNVGAEPQDNSQGIVVA